MMVGRIREILLGRPLATKAIAHERLTNLQGLAVFGSDAMSSTAYATEEILLVLAGAGALATGMSVPVALVIGGLILLVAISYQQVVHAHPEGGGVYSVAKAELGELPSLVGGGALLIDYVLTAAVSTAAGVAALTSAVPILHPYRVWIAVALILLLTLANLRGVRESGRMFMIPPLAFVALFAAMIGYGMWREINGTFPLMSTEPIPAAEPLGALGIMLFLRAFAGGCAAMTGIETTSNGVQAFKAPESANASKTLLRLALILGLIFVGVTLLSYWGKVVPMKQETVVSQVARNLFGRGPMYFAIQAATMMVLLLGANTPFNGFPRVASQLGRDGFFPRQFSNLGTRVVFSNGILFLAGFAILLIVLFQGDVHALIPLYAVGVFLCFSLSQAGMVSHWRRLGRHRRNILLNATGCVATSIAFIIVLTYKFTHGAWILLPAMMIIILLMKKVKAHYVEVAGMLSPEAAAPREISLKKVMVVLVASVNRGVIHACEFSRSFHPEHLRAVHIATDSAEGDRVRRQWNAYFPGVQLDVVVEEYRDIVGALLDYLRRLQNEHQGKSIIIVIVEIVPQKFWQHFLHNQMAMRLRYEIEQHPEIHVEILNVPIKVGVKADQLHQPLSNEAEP